MKLGYLILAHERYEELKELLLTLTKNPHDSVFVHHDKKSVFKDDVTKLKKDFTSVEFIQSIDVEWGSASIVSATLNGMRVAVTKDIDYLILLSGSCMPIKSRTDLIEYLKKNNKDFIECHDLRCGPWVKAGLEKERWEHYNLFNWRKDPIFFSLIHNAQSILRVRRKFPNGITPVLGSQWWCLKKETIRRVVDFTDNSNAEKFLKSTWIPDEFYIQSVVNSINSVGEINDILMYYRFNDVGIPKLFTMADINELISAKQDKFFARKMDFKDEKLISLLSGIYNGKSYSDLKTSSINSVLRPSLNKYLTDSSNFSKISPIYAFIVKNNKEKIIELFESLRDEFKECVFFDELFSKNRIIYGLGDVHPLYDEYNTQIRNYDPEYFTKNVLDNGSINMIIIDLDDFNRVNHILRDNPFLTYVFYGDVESTKVSTQIEYLKLIRYLKSTGIDVIHEPSLNQLKEKLRAQFNISAVNRICKNCL
ncbi:TPA: beta-1,6-N-acetylglucosaminyltransferase [Escherichia coli]